MQLTITSINDIISTGEAVHSALAEAFIENVERELGLSVLACYMDSSLQLLLPAVRRTSRIKWKKICADPKFVNFLNLTVYTRADADSALLQKESVKEKMISIFLETVRSEKQQIEYPRSFLPDEADYYGGRNLPECEWDVSKIIQPIAPPSNRTMVVLENISELAMWHYLSGSLKKINRLEIVDRLSAKVYCGWDDRSSVTLFVILPDYAVCELTEELKKECTRELLSVVMTKDKLGVWKLNMLSPIYTSWNALPEEQRFSLLRN